MPKRQIPTLATLQIPQPKKRRLADEGYERLKKAALSGDAGLIQALIDDGIDIHHDYGGGATALMLAAQQGHAAVVEVLVGKGAAIDIRSAQGFTALHFAAERGHLDVVAVLLAYNAVDAAINTQSAHRVTALMLASQQGHAAVVEALVGKGAAINTQSAHRVTALMLAAQCGHLDVVEALLAAGAAINIQDDQGATALMLAAQCGYLDVVEALLAAGAGINYRDNTGVSALMVAAQRGHLDVVEALVGKGAPIDIQSAHGVTALMLAALQGHLDVVEALVGKGAAIDIQNVQGVTALMVAAQCGYLDVVEALLAADAAINIQDAQGATALMAAVAYDHLEVVELLLNRKDLQVTQAQLDRLFLFDEQNPEKNLIGAVSQILRYFPELGDALSSSEKNKVALWRVNSILRRHIVDKMTQPSTRIALNVMQLISRFTGQNAYAEDPFRIAIATAAVCKESAQLRMELTLQRQENARLLGIIEHLKQQSNGRDEIERAALKPRPTSQTARENQERLNLARPVGFFNGKNHKPAAIEPRERKMREVTSVSMPKEGWQPHPAP